LVKQGFTRFDEYHLRGFQLNRHDLLKITSVFGDYMDKKFVKEMEMAKRIIMYNLAENVTDEEFKKYVVNEKGPLINSLPGVKKYELVKIMGAMGGKSPYKYVGILHMSSLEEFDQKAVKTQKYQDFLKKFGTMAKDLVMLSGEEIY
jgi:uncharacterized protein (TIGR02118 family)